MNPIAPLLLAGLPLLPAADRPEWSGFRGNNGAGVGEVIPAAFDRDVNLLWRTELPPGYSSPIVAGDRVFLTAAEGKTLSTLCLDKATGEVRWRKDVPYDGSRAGANSAAAPTPATDGERVFALFHHVGLLAYDVDGKELWRNDMGAPFDIPHGLATSPVTHSGLVVVQLDQDNSSRLVALDAATGKERWSVDRPGVTHGYSTPVIYEPAEGAPRVITSGALQVAAYSLEDGAKIWWVDGSAWQTKAVPLIHGDLCIVSAYMVPGSEFGMPRFSQTWEEVLAEKDQDGDGKIAMSEWDHAMLRQAWFIFDLDGDQLLDAKDYAYLQLAGTAMGGLFAIQLGGEGDVTESHVVWRYDDRRGLSDLTSPVLVGETMFMVKSGGILTSIDVATGETVKQARLGDPDQYFASPVAADGRVLTASQTGQISVLSGKGEWEVISTSDLDEQVWSTPALAGELVFVRSLDALYCFFADEG